MDLTKSDSFRGVGEGGSDLKGVFDYRALVFRVCCLGTSGLYRDNLSIVMDFSG